MASGDAIFSSQQGYGLWQERNTWINCLRSMAKPHTGNDLFTLRAS
jgi:hypothetical protein